MMASSSRVLIVKCSALGRLSSARVYGRILPLNKTVQASTVTAIANSIKKPFVKETSPATEAENQANLISQTATLTDPSLTDAEKLTSLIKDFQAYKAAFEQQKTELEAYKPRTITSDSAEGSAHLEFQLLKDHNNNNNLKAQLDAKDAELDASNAALDAKKSEIGTMQKEFEHYVVEADKKVSKLEGEKVVLEDQLEVLKAEMKSITRIAVEGLGKDM